MVDYREMRRAMMRVNSRDTLPPIPDDWANLLTPEQVITVNQYANYGWDLWFIRRPRGDQPKVALKNVTTGECALIDTDGQFIQDHGLTLRP